MANRILKLDDNYAGGDAFVIAAFAASPYNSAKTGNIWYEFEYAISAATRSDLLAITAKSSSGFFVANIHNSNGATGAPLNPGTSSYDLALRIYLSGGQLYFSIFNGLTNSPLFQPSGGILANTIYKFKIHLATGNPFSCEAWCNDVSMGTIPINAINWPSVIGVSLELYNYNQLTSGGAAYYDNTKCGSSDGATNYINDDFEGGSINTSIWNYNITGASIITDTIGFTAPAGNIDSDVCKVATTVSSGEQSSISDAATLAVVTSVISSQYNYVYSSPQNDANAGNWSPNSGTTLYTQIDDPTPDDTDYISASVV